MGFLFGVNVYLFTPIYIYTYGAFLCLKIVKTCQKMGIHGNLWLFMYIYSNKKVVLWCKCICIYSYGAFLWLKTVCISIYSYGAFYG